MSVAAIQLNSVFQRGFSNSSSSEVIRHAFPRSHVRVPWPQSKWYSRLQKRFDELTSLRRGWDGYRGSPVSFNCAMFASAILESIFDDSVDAPSLVPRADGTVQIEWHLNHYDVEVEVIKPFEVFAVRHDHQSGLTEEIELQEDFKVLADWIVDLSRERNPRELANL